MNNWLHLLQVTSKEGSKLLAVSSIHSIPFSAATFDNLISVAGPDPSDVRNTSVTSTNFSFLNFGKFLKFCSDVKKVFLKFCRIYLVT